MRFVPTDFRTTFPNSLIFIIKPLYQSGLLFQEYVSSENNIMCHISLLDLKLDCGWDSMISFFGNLIC